MYQWSSGGNAREDFAQKHVNTQTERMLFWAAMDGWTHRGMGPLLSAARPRIQCASVSLSISLSGVSRAIRTDRMPGNKHRHTRNGKGFASSSSSSSWADCVGHGLLPGAIALCVVGTAVSGTVCVWQHGLCAHTYMCLCGCCVHTPAPRRFVESGCDTSTGPLGAPTASDPPLLAAVGRLPPLVAGDDASLASAAGTPTGGGSAWSTCVGRSPGGTAGFVAPGWLHGTADGCKVYITQHRPSYRTTMRYSASRLALYRSVASRCFTPPRRVRRRKGCLVASLHCQ